MPKKSKGPSAKDALKQTEDLSIYAMEIIDVAFCIRDKCKDLTQAIAEKGDQRKNIENLVSKAMAGLKDVHVRLQQTDQSLEQGIPQKNDSLSK